MQRYLIFILVAFLTSQSGFAQEDAEVPANSRPNVQVKASYHFGFLIPHRTRMQHIPKEYTQGIELNIEKASSGHQDWEKLYNHPTVGLSILFTGAGNYDVLGNAIGINPYVSFPLVRSEKFQLYTSWGWGLGYLTNKYDPAENHKNNAIGSHLNLFASIKLKAEYVVARRLALSLGCAFNHWSNSALQYPNLGLNVPTISAGARYSFYDPISYSKLPKAERKKIKPSKKNEFAAIASVGFRAYSSTDNNIYPVYTLSGQYARLWSKKYKLSVGADVFYSTALQQQIENAGETGSKTALQVGTIVSYHQTLGKFSILLGMGVYVFEQTDFGETFYHRFGTRFNVGKRFMINTALHTHWARADHMEFGIGYQLAR
ncbi:acyloxyacyl hydrolase [bacterium SCSIO 12741]|nr:acyloxyacyl hydrolase [bacterium SCSIO 12741]